MRLVFHPLKNCHLPIIEYNYANDVDQLKLVSKRRLDVRTSLYNYYNTNIIMKLI